MKRTTLFVPEELERDLQLYARHDGRSASSLVREALTEYVARRRDQHRLPSFAGQFESGRSDTAERHEDLLFKRLEPHGESPEAARPRPPGRGRARARAASRR